MAAVSRKERTRGRAENDRIVLTLRARGYSIRKIAKLVGMSPSGVQHALERLKED